MRIFLDYKLQAAASLTLHAAALRGRAAAGGYQALLFEGVVHFGIRLTRCDAFVVGDDAESEEDGKAEQAERHDFADLKALKLSGSFSINGFSVRKQL